MCMRHFESSHARTKGANSPRMVEVDHQHNRGLFRLGGHWGCAGLDRGLVEGVVMGGRKGFGGWGIVLHSLAQPKGLNRV